MCVQVRQETSLYLENVAKAKSVAAMLKRKGEKAEDKKRKGTADDTASSAAAASDAAVCGPLGLMFLTL